MACAAQWASHPCELAQRNIGPECLPDGTLPLGEPCRNRSQCASGRCDYESEQCSRCGPEAEWDGSCGEHLPCAFVQQCIDGTCVTPFERLGQPEGEECQGAWVTCGVGLRCFADAQGVSRCQPRLQLGDACPSEISCDAETICEDGTCVALPRAGEPCRPWLDGSYQICAPGSYCDEDPVAPTCWPSKGLEEACAPTASELGGAVRQQPQCAADLVCGDCDRKPGCTGTCQRLLWEGEDCTAQHTRCATGTECVAGVCVGVRPQGDDAPLCP